MIYLTQIVALLQVALSLLVSTAGTPQYEQANQFANQAIVLAQTAIEQELAKTATTTIEVAPTSAPVTEPIVQNQTPIVTVPETVPQTQPQIIKMNTLEIINPLPGKGLGRKYTAQPEVYDDTNYIDIGAVIRDPDGKPLKDVTVQVTATDTTQNRTMQSTGNVVNLYPNGVQTPTAFYPFHYEFKIVGTHTITFTSGDLTQTITVEVSAPDPA